MTPRDAMASPWLPEVFAAMDRMTPAAMSPMALKTSTLYPVEALAQNSFSTIQVYRAPCRASPKGWFPRVKPAVSAGINPSAKKYP